jgi:tRNA G18 (ribose-2'-O)-methylase SpoU
LLKTISTNLPYSFQNTSLSTIDERCNEYFDEAKQTGISFQKFKPLFHRYGKAIEELTEMAFEKMNETRNPEEIWKKAELDFQQKEEWQNSERKPQ